MAKRVGGRGSAPDPAGEAYDAPLNPLVGWGGDAFAAPTLNFGVPIVVNLRNDCECLIDKLISYRLLLLMMLTQAV